MSFNPVFNGSLNLKQTYDLILNSLKIYKNGVASDIFDIVYTKDEIDTITGEITLPPFTADRVIISDSNGDLNASNIAVSTLSFLDATSSIQTQINNKANISDVYNKTVMDILLNGKQNTISLTGERVLVSDATGLLSVSGVSTTTLSYLDATSSIQSQLDTKLQWSSASQIGAEKVLITDGLGFSETSGTDASKLQYLDNVNSDIQAQLSTKVQWGGEIGSEKILTTNSLGAVEVSATDRSKLQYLNNVNSDIQQQIDNVGGIPTLTANRAIISDGAGDIAVSTITNTELGYLSGATSNIQNQINNFIAGSTDHSYTTGYTVPYKSDAVLKPIPANVIVNYGTLNTVVFNPDSTLFIGVGDLCAYNASNFSNVDLSGGYTHITKLNASLGANPYIGLMLNPDTTGYPTGSATIFLTESTFALDRQNSRLRVRFGGVNDAYNLNGIPNINDYFENDVYVILRMSGSGAPTFQIYNSSFELMLTHSPPITLDLSGSTHPFGVGTVSNTKTIYSFFTVQDLNITPEIFEWLLSSSPTVDKSLVSSNRVLITNSENNIISSSITDSTLEFLDATSSVQTQLNTKVQWGGEIGTEKILTTNSLGAAETSATDRSKLQYLDNVSSDIQAQIDATVDGCIEYEGITATTIEEPLQADVLTESNNATQPTYNGNVITLTHNISVAYPWNGVDTNTLNNTEWSVCIKFQLTSTASFERFMFLLDVDISKFGAGIYAAQSIGRRWFEISADFSGANGAFGLSNVASGGLIDYKNSNDITSPLNNLWNGDNVYLVVRRNSNGTFTGEVYTADFSLYVSHTTTTTYTFVGDGINSRPFGIAVKDCTVPAYYLTFQSGLTLTPLEYAAALYPKPLLKSIFVKPASLLCMDTTRSLIYSTEFQFSEINATTLSNPQTYGSLTFNETELTLTPIFNPSFSSPPRMFLQLLSNHPSILNIMAYDITTTGFKVKINDLSTNTNVIIGWLAIF
jgi:hypothetical protein